MTLVLLSSSFKGTTQRVLSKHTFSDVEIAQDLAIAKKF